MKAYLYQPMEDSKVKCNLCHHRCVIPQGKRGICAVRENQDGELVSLVYAQAIAASSDPIEKKPLFHVLPGSRSFSIATVGCNFHCRFCQNSNIAQMPRDLDGKIMGRYFPPDQVVAQAKQTGCKTIAYTYTEPTIYFEYAYDTAKLAAQEGLRNVFVTNGYETPEAIEKIAPYLHAANVDLKAFSPGFYKEMCGAKLENVLETLKCMHSAGIFLEITTLIIPGLNDDPAQLEELAGFIAQSLSPQTPWHVSRFHPTYNLIDRSATPPATLFQAHEIGKKAGLHYVYTGNIPGQGGENTYCHHCQTLLIERMGYTIQQNVLKNGTCPNCQTPAHGLWK
ncbi:MAG: AmmeMemoRadiSam system radical SAM enzyme [Desulfatibacillum sp.]|nr:AmmeMemoRadiSam system radical SAM enzyme [Desulfatibacillum sp.]